MNSMRGVFLVVWAGLAWGMASPAGASDFDEITKLLASDGNAGEQFGRAVSTDGSAFLVGAPNYSEEVPFAGAAFMFRREPGGIVLEQTLVPFDPMPSHQFGSRVAVDGDVAIIGAPDDEDRTTPGSAYVFRFTGISWNQEQKLVPSDGLPGDTFGNAVAIQGDVAIVGAPSHSAGPDFSGAAWVFRFDGSTWVEEQKLTGSDAAPQDSFGSSVALSGTLACVGAVNSGVGGAAYAFRDTGSSWVEEQRMVASDAAAGDSFGSSVGASGEMVVVGAPFDNSNRGAAYVFRTDGASWAQEAKLVAADGASFHSFGQSVSAEGDLVVAGATGSTQDRGAAYVFRRATTAWAQAQKLTASDGAQSDFLGWAASVSKGMVVVGAPLDDDSGSTSGSAYVYYTPTCHAGSVNAANGLVVNSLFINGLSGEPDRVVEVPQGQLLSVTLLKPFTGGNGRFVLHANEGEEVTFDSETVLPADVGLTCFPFLLSQGASPVVVANSIGKESLVGASHYYGTPAEDPERASTTIQYPNLPIGTVLTFQGVIVDPGSLSPKAASTTNAVVIRIVP